MADLRRNIGIPSGVVFPFAGTTAPYGYLICDGRAVSRSDYADLFMMIGTSHGVGDGSTTFNLPDYRGNFLRGKVDITTITGSGTVSSNNATFTSHGVNRTGFKVRLSSGTLSGLATSTDYYAIVVDSNTLAFATSLANAIAGTKIAISGANSAVIVQYEDPDRLGVGIGDRQDNQMGAHKHWVLNGGTGGGSKSFAVESGPAGTITNSLRSGSYNNDDSYTTLTTGSEVADRAASSYPLLSNYGNETRPANVNVNYIIKV
jgi:microcystin-dependent protein